MADKATYDVRFRRRLENKTNYVKRLGLVKGGVPRLVIRRSNNCLTLQLIEFNETGDKTLAGMTSNKLDSLGWKHSKKNLPASYLAGLFLGKQANKKGIKKAILDLGLYTPVWKTKIFAALKGVIDAGIEIPHNKEILPDEKRIQGTHIQAHGKTSGALNITQDFNTVKQKILQEGK